MTTRWLAAPPPVTGLGVLPPSPAPRRLKLLHVITRFEAGAGGNTLLSAIGMDRSRYDVWIAGGAGGPLWERAAAAGLKTMQLPGFWKEVAPKDDLKILLGLTRLIRTERFDIVHVHSAKAGVLGRVAAWLCQVPVVVCTIHGRDPWWPDESDSDSPLNDLMSAGRRRLFRRVERALSHITDSFVAVSPTVARDAVRAGIAAPGRITVAPSAVDTEEVPVAKHTRIRQQLGIPQHAQVVGTVGRLDVQKNPVDFVRMAALVQRAISDVRFVMVGEGELTDQTRALAADLNVPLLLTGYRSDAPLIASTFDVYVVPSLYEGVGRAVTEALASGRPVVATAVDGVVDVVTHGSTGLLVRPRDVEALAAATIWMLQHPTQAMLMGCHGRDLVRDLFSPSRMCAVLDETYREQFGAADESARGRDDALAVSAS
jgi:glycosyltransferase involved in cell wall biosynthesis